MKLTSELISKKSLNLTFKLKTIFYLQEEINTTATVQDIL